MCRGRICLRRRRDFGSRCGPSVTELCGILGFRDAADFEDEVGDDGNVDEKKERARKCRAMNELVHFERDEAGGRDYREKLGPAFAQEEANALGKEESGVNKRPQTERTKFVGIHGGQFFEQEIQVVIVGIDAEEVRPMLGLHYQILVGEHMDGDAHGKKHKTFEKFEGGDEHQTARAFAGAGHWERHCGPTGNGAQLR